MDSIQSFKNALKEKERREVIHETVTDSLNYEFNWAILSPDFLGSIRYKSEKFNEAMKNYFYRTYFSPTTPDEIAGDTQKNGFPSFKFEIFFQNTLHSSISFSPEMEQENRKILIESFFKEEKLKSASIDFNTETFKKDVEKEIEEFINSVSKNILEKD